MDGRDEVPDAVTSYAVGSITKTFTATLVMRLRDEGLLRLDDPVDQHVTDVDLQGRSVGQLLAQTTGLRAEPPGPWWERVDGPEWSSPAAAVAADDLLQPAGRRFHYSNLGYALLGRLVEVLRGASWGACLDREILRPLGMDATTVGAPQVHAPGLAVHPWADLVLSEPAPDYRAMAPAGALWSTIADLAVWARFLLGETGEVLDPGTLDEMLEPGGADADVTGASAYGLGVQVHQVDGRTLVGHGGSVPGHVAGVLVDRAERTAAMAVANATQGDLGELLPRLLAIVREREPLVVDEWRPTAGATAAPPLDVTGVWYWGATPIAVRAGGNGGLHLEALGGRGRTSRFAPTGKDLWRGRDGYYAGEELRALRDTGGGITHLDVATFVLTRARTRATRSPEARRAAPGAMLPATPAEPRPRRAPCRTAEDPPRRHLARPRSGAYIPGVLRWRSRPAGGPARPAGVMALLPGWHVPDAEVAYRLASPVVLAVINALFRMRTSGSLPAAGPVLLAPNHVSFVDPLVLAVAAWRQGRALRFLVVRGAMQHPVTGWVITASRQIPVEPQGTGGRALSAAEEALRRGDVVCVYPQGGVVEGGGARRVRTGVARLARATGVPVTPAATVGCERVRPWWRALRRRQAEVLFGAPVAARSEEGDHAFAQRVIHEISTLAETAIDDRGSRRDHLAN